jgi:hypothetical protein
MTNTELVEIVVVGSVLGVTVFVVTMAAATVWMAGA